MKRLLSLLLIFIPLFVFSQEKVTFHLQEDGTFKTENGSTYIVVPFNDMSANQIYSEIKNNINKIYKNSKEVISEVEDMSISVRGYSEAIATDKMPLCAQSVYSGYYNLLFEFKDGKVKVNAPRIDEYVHEGLSERKFEYIASGFFKKGVPNPKKNKYREVTELQMNVIVNQILALSKNEDKDDW